MLKKNRQLANILAMAALLGAFALPLIATAIWFFGEQPAQHAAGSLQYKYTFNLSSLSVSGHFIGFTLSLIGATIQAYSLLGLRTTFLEAATDNPLSDKAIHGFRRFAWVALIMVLIGVIQRTGFIVIFSLNDPAHPGILDIQFGTHELKALFMGLLLVFVAHVFNEGKRAKDENETFL